MKAKISSVRRISWIIILLLPLALAYHLIPRIHFMLNPHSNSEALRNVIHETYESSEHIDMHHLWEMRSTLSHGYYEKNLAGIPWKTIQSDTYMKPVMSCLAHFSKDIRVVAVYHSHTWSTLEMLVQRSGSALILKTCLQSDQADDVMDFRFSTPHGALFLTVRPLERMKKTVGFIDYEGEHRDIVKDTVWYSLSHISLD